MYVISSNDINYNDYRMSSLGLITRSSIPALTSVLVGPVLILLNRWMNGSDVDKHCVVQIIGGHPLNTPLDGLQSNMVTPDICQFLCGVVIVWGLIHFLNLSKLFCKYFLDSKDPCMEDSAYCICTVFLGGCIVTLGLAICLSPINNYLMVSLLYLYIFTLNVLEWLVAKQLNVRYK